MKKFLCFILALLLIKVASADAINIDWIVDGQTYEQTSCNLGDDLIVPATPPTKYGYTFQGWETYAPIEYIQATGTQYIDTGYIPSYLTRVQTKMQTSAYGFGAASSWQSRGFEFMGDSALYFVYGGTVKNIGGGFQGYTFEIDWNKNVIDYSMNGVAQSQIQFSSQTFVAPLTMALFAIHRPSQYYKAAGKIYYFKIYNDNVLVRDFIPVRRNSNGEIGMFDKVSRTFYGNKGTGDFIAGPDL